MANKFTVEEMRAFIHGMIDQINNPDVILRVWKIIEREYANPTTGTKTPKKNKK